MTLVSSIMPAADGFTIKRSTGAVVRLASVDIPSNAKGSFAQTEAWINNWITQQGWVGKCRVRSITPLVVDVVLGRQPIPANHFDRS